MIPASREGFGKVGADDGAGVLWHLFRYLRSSGAPFPLRRANGGVGAHEMFLGEWFLAVNGHDHAVRCFNGALVPPFAAYCENGGVCVGVLDLVGEASVFVPELLPDLSRTLEEAAGPEPILVDFAKAEQLGFK